MENIFIYTIYSTFELNYELKGIGCLGMFDLEARWAESVMGYVLEFMGVDLLRSFDLIERY